MNSIPYVVVQEAKTSVVEVDVVDPSALQRTLSYLYTGSYDDEILPLIDYVASEMDVLQDNTDSETCSIEPRDPNESAVEQVGASASLPESDARSPQTETEDIIQYEQLSPIISAADEDRLKRTSPNRFATIPNFAPIRSSTSSQTTVRFSQ